MADTALQRKNMVESQVRPSDVTDRRIIAAMLEIPREEFVPGPLRSIAYMDSDVSLAALAPGRVPRALMAPRVFSKLIALAEIGAKDVVLDVGTGSGYSAAIIAKLVETVVALESDPELVKRANASLSALSFDNTAVVQGDLAKGWPSAGPYAAIIMEGAIEVVPHELLTQLKDGGRLVAVVNDGRTSKAVVWLRIGDDFDRRDAFDAAAPALPGFAKAKTFSL